MKDAKKIALAGIFTALAVVFLFVGSLFQTLDLSAAALGSIIILIALIEIGKGWAIGVYVSVSLLSMLLIPNKTAALIFMLFSGFYPIIKAPLNRIKPIWFSYLVRITVFNAFLTALVYFSKQFFGIEEDFIGFGVIIYALCNITFLVYDFALERIAVTYISRIKPMLFRRR